MFFSISIRRGIEVSRGFLRSFFGYTVWNYACYVWKLAYPKHAHGTSILLLVYPLVNFVIICVLAVALDPGTENCTVLLVTVEVNDHVLQNRRTIYTAVWFIILYQWITPWILMSHHANSMTANLSMGSFALVGGPSNQPWTGHGGPCKFYKVNSLAVATRISHKYQVLLDDGNRIIIPQGNFKISILHLVIFWYTMYTCVTW